MVWLMRRCMQCKRYTLRKDACPYCGGNLRIPNPAKFSPNDKYAMHKGMMRNLRDEGDNNTREGKS